MRGDADESWFETHNFLGSQHERHERRTWMVVALTAATMVVEIVGGAWFNSMALLADGWHMATHAGAMGLAALAYRFARRHARNPRFTFGTGKVGDLAAYSSGIILAVAAVMIGWESLQRLARPLPIAFDQAILVAVLGLAVNIISAGMLWTRHGHGHAHADVHKHDHGHVHHHTHHADHNIRAAFLHVVADAMTSVLAIVALVAGRWFGVVWLDPVMGLVGAVVILHWSIGLMRDTGGILLDMEAGGDLAARIRTDIESKEGDRVADLHVWRVGPGHFAAIVAIVTRHATDAGELKMALKERYPLAHLTVEVLATAPKGGGDSALRET
ncbi:CDF family Co(II)/Ni(II) efflux transporter DmeF [Dongia deserti]|uniref:CDF family Co(II)/Ni(II) efflux transporter DmeF n=1 Tax=Dongia deserti TaxID=2268030 RepID=UPI000E651D19|nr:CDF family Co(II)/Ni(II) efflux transporter DmeF [Dongia deserti]